MTGLLWMAAMTAADEEEFYQREEEGGVRPAWTQGETRGRGRRKGGDGQSDAEWGG